MTYLQVEWIHLFENEPIEMLSELDSQRNEIRKVERFRDGSLNFAGPEGASGSTMLSELPLPDLNDIAADPQFHAAMIGKDAFEDCWKIATMSVVV
jgi:hypothetical protein